MFDQSKKEIPREELYELVWTSPIKKVGEIFGVSDSTIRKMCKQFNIPLPDNSYRWKMNAGQNPIRIPLPKRDGHNFMSFQESTFMENKSNQEISGGDFEYLDDPLRSKVLKIYYTLKVPEENVRNHRLVTAYIEEMAERKRHRKKYQNDLLFHRRDEIPILNIYATDEVIPRTYKIATILLNALEEIGCTIDVTHGPSIINIRGVQIAFRFKETSTRVLQVKNKYGYSSSELVPNGKLALVCGIYGSYKETAIVDTNATKLEGKINTAFKKIIDFSQAQIEINKRNEELDRLIELERIEKERIKMIRDTETRKVKSLLRDFILWEKAKNLRDYINALEANLGDDISDKEKDYIQWARKKADWIDPAIDAEDEILEPIENEADVLKLLIPIDKENPFKKYW